MHSGNRNAFAAFSLHPKLRYVRTAIPFIILFLYSTFGFCQTDGSYDLTYGTNGKVILSLDSLRDTRGTDLIPLGDGSLIVGGNVTPGNSPLASGFYITKLDVNGSIDLSFGVNGFVLFEGSTQGNSNLASFIQLSSEKLLVCCSLEGVPSLIRLHPNGTLDTGFGLNGIAQSQDVSFIQELSNGKIIALGQYYDGYNNYYRFSRYHANGDLDLSFGNNGIKFVNITPYRYDLAYQMKLQSDEKMVVIGASYDFGYDQHPIISRFDPDGNLDTSFKQLGYFIVPVGDSPNYGEFHSVQILPDNRIVAAGHYNYPGGTGGGQGTKPLIVRFQPNGDLDNSFSGDGIEIMNTIFGGNDRFNDLLVQDDGKYIFVGNVAHLFPDFQTHFYITRLHADGSVDFLNYGNSGSVIFEYDGAETNMLYRACHQFDGKTLVLGIGRNVNTNRFDALVYRFNNNPLSTTENSLNSVTVYPNPAENLIQLEHIEHVERIQLINAMGQLVFSWENNQFKHTQQFDFGSLGAGMYFLSLQGKEGDFSVPIQLY